MICVHLCHLRTTKGAQATAARSAQIRVNSRHSWTNPVAKQPARRANKPLVDKKMRPWIIQLKELQSTPKSVMASQSFGECASLLALSWNTLLQEKQPKIYWNV
jgi:hypothetical protein